MNKKRKFKERDPEDGTAALGRTIALDEESANNLVAYQASRNLILWEEIQPAKPATDSKSE